MTENKIPIANIYYLLCYAWNQLEEAGRINVSASDYTQYIDLFAKVLKNGCAYVFKRGLDRDYVGQISALSQIKGKIDFNNSLKYLSVPTTKMICSHDELSIDVLHNQIIKATIRKVLKVKSLDKSIHKDLAEIYKRIINISDIDLNTNHFKKIRLHSNNLFYRYILNIAYIIHQNLVLDEKTGNYEFVDFVRDEKKMARVFEYFVRNFFIEELKHTEFEVKSEIIKWDLTNPDPFSIDYLPVMKTDISITSQKRKIVIDTKYYKECFSEFYDRQKIISSNLYQLFAYLKNLEKNGGAAEECEGILLYPTVKNEVDLTFRSDKHKIIIKTINLNQDWRLIRKNLLTIVD